MGRIPCIWAHSYGVRGRLCDTFRVEHLFPYVPPRHLLGRNNWPYMVSNRNAMGEGGRRLGNMSQYAGETCRFDTLGQTC
jgi:hypothetical protein